MLGGEDAPVVITGSAHDFCWVGAQRLAPAESDLKVTGEDGDLVLDLLRNYAT